MHTFSRGCAFLFTYVKKLPISFLYDCLSGSSYLSLYHRSDLTPALDCHMNKPIAYKCTGCNSYSYDSNPHAYKACCPDRNYVLEVPEDGLRVSDLLHECQVNLSNNLKCIDALASLPYIPSHKMNYIAHLIDKTEALQQNVHKLRQYLAHLG